MARQRAQASAQIFSIATNMQSGRTKTHEEADTDAGSQRIEVLDPLSGKPKGGEKEIKDLRTKVSVDKRELHVLLQQRLRQIENEESSRRNELASLISQALKIPGQRSQHNAATYSNTEIATNQTFMITQKVSNRCLGLMSEYKAFEEMIQDMAGDNGNEVTETWARDMAEVERRLKLGHKVALRNVKKVLGMPNKGDGEVAGEDEKMAEAENEKPQLNRELQKSLRYAERGVKRMVKGLPRDQPHCDQMKA